MVPMIRPTTAIMSDLINEVPVTLLKTINPKAIKEKYSGKQVDVVGHTDTEPIKKSSWKDNWELSAQRALSVTRYLIDHGIPDKQVEASG